MIVHPNVARNTSRGSILYIKQKQKTNLQKVETFHDNGEFEESIIIEVKLKGKDKLLCSCMYRRAESTTDNNEKFMENIRHMTNLRYIHFLMMGDFNLREKIRKTALAKLKTLQT